ncbi:hypothetical protein B5P43_35475 [Bacillus sp. SRB_336]|nr:hypothetical protein B5P43_35475 [Bacillus sp. SRB_336]
MNGNAGADQLVLEHLGLADSLSRRYRAQGSESEDLLQVARLGLVKAAMRYREPGNHGFVAYAVPTILGELKRHCRDHSWVVRPPRSIQEARLKIRQVRPELTQRLGRDPSLADLGSATMGPATVMVIGKIFEAASIEEAAFDPALAVLRLARRFSPTRVEAACVLALRGPIRSPRYAHLRPILDTGQDKTGHVPDESEADDGGYVRGSAYYAGGTR